MKEWKEPQLFDLGIKNTEANLCGKGNDEYIPDCIENFLEHFLGDIFGSKLKS